MHKGYRTNLREHQEIFAHEDDVAVTVHSVNNCKQWQIDRTLAWTGMAWRSTLLKARQNSCRRDVNGRNTTYTREKVKYAKQNLFKYFGVQIDSGNHLDTEINSRIAKYTSNYMMMYPLLKEAAVPRGVNTILKTILLYGSDCWDLTSRTWSKLQAAEMKVL